MEVEVLNKDLQCISHDTYIMRIFIKVNKIDKEILIDKLTKYLNNFPIELKGCSVGFLDELKK